MRNRDSKTSRRIVGVTLAIFVVLALPFKAAGQTDNTAYGNKALTKATSGGNFDSAFGDNALYALEYGSYNTAVGANALEHLNCPSNGELYNTAAGFDALEYDECGSLNTATGAGALNVNENGSNNTATGFDALFNNTADYNTATGDDALVNNTSGTKNTATGANALSSTKSANQNTATGYGALYKNTADNNTATGTDALIYNTSGTQNTATGGFALDRNSGGSFNTATGYTALYNNTASYNTATGNAALYSNTTGTYNTATGMYALYSNSAGTYNTATGMYALYNNNGNDNTATGWGALVDNTSGGENTAAGTAALGTSTAGNNNTALGFQAGVNVSTGSNNIEIGNNGASGDANTIRIGSTVLLEKPMSQNPTFIAGIFNSPLSGAANVIVTSAGRLGVVASSARYKRDIRAMGERSQQLMRLRPVTFRYKQDPLGQRQYGLIAEEVAQVYPELVVRGAKGEVESVQYYELVPMLLNEVQKRQRRIQQLTRQREQQAAQNLRLSAEVAQLKGMFEQAMAAQKGSRGLAAAFSR